MRDLFIFYLIILLYIPYLLIYLNKLFSYTKIYHLIFLDLLFDRLRVTFLWEGPPVIDTDT